MTCGRCGGDIGPGAVRTYVMESGKLTEIHPECKRENGRLPNVFRVLGFPDAKRDRSQPKGSYVWHD